MLSRPPPSPLPRQPLPRPFAGSSGGSSRPARGARAIWRYVGWRQISARMAGWGQHGCTRCHPRCGTHGGGGGRRRRMSTAGQLRLAPRSRTIERAARFGRISLTRGGGRYLLFFSLLYFATSPDASAIPPERSQARTEDTYHAYVMRPSTVHSLPAAEDGATENEMAARLMARSHCPGHIRDSDGCMISYRCVIDTPPVRPPPPHHHRWQRSCMPRLPRSVDN